MFNGVVLSFYQHWISWNSTLTVSPVALYRPRQLPESVWLSGQLFSGGLCHWHVLQVWLILVSILFTLDFVLISFLSSFVFYHHGSGMFGERLPLRYYLTAGMLLSGLFTSLFGLGFYWNIHALWYYCVMQVRFRQHFHTRYLTVGRVVA